MLSPRLARLLLPLAALALTGAAVAGEPPGGEKPDDLQQLVAWMTGSFGNGEEVRIDASGLDTWDRGFDAEGRQVWGAEKRPYLLRRR